MRNLYHVRLRISFGFRVSGFGFGEGATFATGSKLDEHEDEEDTFRLSAILTLFQNAAPFYLSERMFKPGDLFDLSQTSHNELFDGCEHAW